jgi:hypothetical protein
MLLLGVILRLELKQIREQKLRIYSSPRHIDKSSSGKCSAGSLVTFLSASLLLELPVELGWFNNYLSKYFLHSSIISGNSFLYSSTSHLIFQ